MTTPEVEFIEAAKTGGAAMIRAFLRIDPGLCHSVGDHNKTALHWAAEGDHVEVAAALIETGADARKW
jgi:ankyrin repeat protein